RRLSNPSSLDILPDGSCFRWDNSGNGDSGYRCDTRNGLDEGDVAAERASEDTEEMETVLTTMDAATVLVSGTVEVPTGSGSILTAGPSA
nr:hypothetical protein [Tanacetum cinerariifolium]GFB47599.1 hypothetical protein [Tanacetum cinerariifolium]